MVGLVSRKKCKSSPVGVFLSRHQSELVINTSKGEESEKKRRNEIQIDIQLD